MLDFVKKILLKLRNGAFGVQTGSRHVRRLKTAAAAWPENHRRRRAALSSRNEGDLYALQEQGSHVDLQCQNAL